MSSLCTKTEEPDNDDHDARTPITEWPVQPSDTCVKDHPRTSSESQIHLKQLQQMASCNSTHDPYPSHTSLRRKQEEHKPTAHAVPLKQKRRSEDAACEQMEPLAAVRVARWWRKMKHLSAKLHVASKNPNTLLFHISRTAECQEFLREEKRSLKKKLSCCHGKVAASIYAALASIEDWLDMYDVALNHITAAVEICESNPEHLWLKEKLSKQCKALHIQNQIMEKHTLSDQFFLTPEKVDRVPCQDLSVEEFKEQYVKRQKPVIMEGAVSSMTQQQWNLDYIKAKAGSLSAPVKCRVPGSVEWAKLEEEKVLTVAEHIENIESEGSSDYLFDWSLPLHCPQLAGEIMVPKYFSDNFLTQTSPGSLYHDSWPSLFVAPANVTSDLHVDAFASSFWMALFEGEKRWTFFSEQDLPLLYPHYRHSLDPVFNVDLSKPDLKAFPLLGLTKPKQCVLKPGDLLFVPAGSPHFVENLSASVAVSSNYVDASNYDQVCEELRICGLMDPLAAQLLDQLKSSEFQGRVMSERVHIEGKH